MRYIQGNGEVFYLDLKNIDAVTKNQMENIACQIRLDTVLLLSFRTSFRLSIKSTVLEMTINSTPLTEVEDGVVNYGQVLLVVDIKNRVGKHFGRCVLRDVGGDVVGVLQTLDEVG